MRYFYPYIVLFFVTCTLHRSITTEPARIDSEYYVLLLERSGHVPERAIALCSDAIQEDSSDVAAYLVRSTAWAKLNVSVEAIMDFSEAVTLNPVESEFFFDNARKEFDSSLNKDSLSENDSVKILAGRFGQVSRYKPHTVKQSREIRTTVTEFHVNAQDEKKKSFEKKADKNSVKSEAESVSETSDRNEIKIKATKRIVKRESLLTKYSKGQSGESAAVTNTSTAELQKAEMAISKIDNVKNRSFKDSARYNQNIKRGEPDKVSELVLGTVGKSNIYNETITTDSLGTTPKNIEKESISAIVQHIPYHEKIQYWDQIEKCVRTGSESSSKVAYYMCQGNLYYHRHEYPKAITAFLNALEQDSTHLVAYCMLSRSIGNCYYYSLALQYINRALAIDSMFGRAYFVRAWIYHCKKEREKEIENLLAALRMGYDRGGYVSSRLKLLGVDY